MLVTKWKTYRHVQRKNNYKDYPNPKRKFTSTELKFTYK